MPLKKVRHFLSNEQKNCWSKPQWFSFLIENYTIFKVDNYIRKCDKMILNVRENLVMSNEKIDENERYAIIYENRIYLRQWMSWVDDTTSESIENVRKRWEEQYKNGTDIALGIYFDEKYVGNIGLHGINHDKKSAEIGYWLAENQQGKGIMTDCVRFFANYAFDELNLNVVDIHCAAANAKSRAIPERLGFRQVDVLKNAENLYGILHDLIVYRLEKVRLLFPKTEHKQAVWEYRQEHFDYGEEHIHGSGGMTKSADYESWLEKVTNAYNFASDGWVKASTYLGFIGEKVVGTIQIRHEMNDFMINFGGHIGYGVRPSERRKGYASQMLEQALKICRKMGIEKVLITCDKDNFGSKNTILKQNGVLENEITEENGNILLRYWIDLRNRF